MGWQENFGFVGSSGEKDLGPIEWIEGAGHRRAYTDSKGNRVYRALTPAEQRATGRTPASDDARLAREREKRDTEAARAEAARIQGISDERFKASHEATMEGLRNQGTQITGLLENQRETLKATTAASEAERRQRGDHFNANIKLQTEQIQANNRLLDRRLTLEDQHFQQKMAYDKHQSRRAQILGSLTLISQSLARL